MATRKNQPTAEAPAAVVNEQKPETNDLLTGANEGEGSASTSNPDLDTKNPEKEGAGDKQNPESDEGAKTDESDSTPNDDGSAKDVSGSGGLEGDANVESEPLVKVVVFGAPSLNGEDMNDRLNQTLEGVVFPIVVEFENLSLTQIPLPEVKSVKKEPVFLRAFDRDGSKATVEFNGPDLFHRVVSSLEAISELTKTKDLLRATFQVSA